jgi:hypothetical protein
MQKTADVLKIKNLKDCSFCDVSTEAEDTVDDLNIITEQNQI